MADSPYSLMDVAAVVVAACALILTVWTALTSRKHNKLSVRPHLATSVMREHVSTDKVNAAQVHMILTNVGLGPALVRSADISLDGKVVPIESFEDLRPLLAGVFPSSQLGNSDEFMKLNKGHAIAVGERIDLVKFHLLNPPDNLANELQRFHLLVRYESLYQDAFIYDSRDHLPAST